jgi:predicted RNA binding protein YcfA (HicA-like mRNA interferase family)
LSPRLPRLTAKQLIKKLKEHGYILDASEGSHQPGKIIGPGLLKAILRQLKMKPEDIL